MNAPGGAASFETAEDRTLYWTLSFHVGAGKLWRDARARGGTPAIGAPFRRECVSALQAAEPVSSALRAAIEPLFNDISDREQGGKPVDFLLAAETADGEEGGVAARAFVPITFHPPEAVRWTTEGRRFVAAPDGLAAERAARLRRFWFVHTDGGISWHLGITLGYRHDPADYLFLAMLQKLAAPKEFAVEPRVAADFPAGLPVFAATSSGIDPLERLLVSDGAGGTPRRFWDMVKAYFDADAASLVTRLAQAHGAPVLKPGSTDLLDLTGLVEVPGLLMPRCRTMMYFRDARFFRRLSPQFDAEGNRMPRRLLVQDECYAPYGERLAALIKNAGAGDVTMDDGAPGSFWRWVRERPDCAELTAEDFAALREGSYREEDGSLRHVPAIEPNRSDCLDYLFLSGLNQNIIDFMNQDTSEILDGTDPIYPTDDDQAREGFFVRFANHRSIITYAARARSLEVGNDYIGTCPYAFLVHVLSMHNEFLARDFEAMAGAEIAGIECALDGECEPGGYGHLSRRINALKIARYRDYEQHRYVNVFRYDTERDVFAELEQLRGVQRKDAALDLALSSLEDHADDLEGQRVGERDRNIGAIAFVLGLMALAQGLGMLAEFTERLDLPPWGRLLLTEGLWWVTAALLATLMIVGCWFVVSRWRAIRDLLSSSAPRDPR